MHKPLTKDQKEELNRTYENENICANLLALLPLNLIDVFDPVMENRKDFAKTLSLITFYDVYEFFATDQGYHKEAEEIRSDSIGGVQARGHCGSFTIPHPGVTYPEISKIRKYMSESDFLKELGRMPEQKLININSQDGGPNLYSTNLEGINNLLLLVCETITGKRIASSTESDKSIEEIVQKTD